MVDYLLPQNLSDPNLKMISRYVVPVRTFLLDSATIAVWYPKSALFLRFRN